MDFNHIKSLSFDCYGTLIDWETGLLAAFHKWLEERGDDVSDEDLLALFAKIEPEVEHQMPTTRYSDILGHVLTNIGHLLDIPVYPGDSQVFADSIRNWPAFPDSRKALANLKKKAKLIILSNVDNDSFKASNEKLGDPFDAIYTAEDIGSYKPNPHNFHYLIDKLDHDHGLTTKTHLHVAQSLYHDHEPAKALGLVTVWINRSSRHEGDATKNVKESVNPDYIFPDMESFTDKFLMDCS